MIETQLERIAKALEAISGNQENLTALLATIAGMSTTRPGGAKTKLDNPIPAGMVKTTLNLGKMSPEVETKEEAPTPLPVEPPADLPPVKDEEKKPVGKAPTAKQIKSFVAQRLGEGHKHEILKKNLNAIAPSIDDLDENGRRQFMNYLQSLRITDVDKAA